MDNNNFENQIYDSSGSDLSLESILAEFKAEEQLTGNKRDKASAHSHSIVMEALEQTIGEARVVSSLNFNNFADDDFDTKPIHKVDSNVIEKKPVVFEKENVVFEKEPFEEASLTNNFEVQHVEPKTSHSELHSAEDAFKIFDDDTPNDEYPIWTEKADIDDTRNYAPSETYDLPEDAEMERPSGRDVDYKQKLVSPIVGLIAASSMRRRERAEAEKARLEAEAKKQIPELSPDKAARLYLDQAQAMRLRCLFATVLCTVLVYLSYDFPAMGLLGSSLKIRTLVCMILLLVLMLVGLDFFTNGMVALFKRKPTSESLIAVSSIVSILDASYMAAFGVYTVGLPFCAVSGLSLTFALWGSYLNCKSFALSFRTAALPKSPSVIISMDGGEDNGQVLSKAKRPVTGFVRKSEEADIFETAYSYFAPLFIIFSIILSLFCVLSSDKNNNFIHTLSSCLAVSASFSAVLGFAFPYYILTARLVRSGVAIAGYSGCSELGRIGKVVVTDQDMFPSRTVSIANITVTEGFYPDKVTAYTASMIGAAGMGIASVFTELMKKNGYTMQPVEEFACHEGGGLVARINGDMVYVGSSSFMHLMGIKPPKGSGSNSAVYTAINDTLAGVFEINYVPVTSVQRGLVTLLRGRTDPVFAIRDFNITPMLVKQKFRLPKESYDFPSFAERYTISSPDAEEEGEVVAMFARGGLNSVAGLHKRGKSMYNGLRLCAVLSVLGAFLGMIIMLSMSWSGAYESASVGNAITFMTLWLVPIFVIAYGMRR